MTEPNVQRPTYQAQRVTVLICTSGRPQLLERCLSAIVAGTEIPHQLVVVNGTDGQTPRVVEHYAANFPEVVLVEHPNRNLATLRNLGLPYCSGDIVAMTDDDAIPDCQWIATIRSAHSTHQSAGGIGGAVRGADSDFVSRVADVVVFPDPKPGRPIHTLPTVNMSYKREAMDAVGDFDQTLFRGEDVDFNWRMIRAGYDLAFEPALKVRHQHRSTLLGFLRQQYMYGRAYVLVRRKWPDMYSVYPHSFRSLRSWAKLFYAAGAIFFMPIGVARNLPSTSERVRAYPVLVLHHLVWKLGMLMQTLAGAAVSPTGLETAKVTRWNGCKRAL